MAPRARPPEHESIDGYTISAMTGSTDDIGRGIAVGSTRGSNPENPQNLDGFDYGRESILLGSPPTPIIDVHSHLRGREATDIQRDVMDLMGIDSIWTMTQLDQLDPVEEVLGDRVRFIATANFRDPDRHHAFGEGYINDLEQFRARGARLAKFWAAPGGIDYGDEVGSPGLLKLDSPERIAGMEAAVDLGMGIMVHVADPDTWFRHRYRDHQRYGTKLQQYEPMRRLMERFTVPWLAAHMGGWPENLEFLDQLLQSHSNLHLDTSATKWMVRELSRQPRAELVDFLDRWQGRILFGSDNVVSNDHLGTSGEGTIAEKATDPTTAFDLYASRYWALRSMFETELDIESPIQDPDRRIEMLLDSGIPDIQAHIADSEIPRARLRGLGLDSRQLCWLYSRAASEFHEKLEALH
ncbi:MAG: hypothetical protein CMJ32_04095 [Phycisphaerae bacterium]|nr:hypothetical protein [Phycisphaerae bacterium]